MVRAILIDDHVGCGIVLDGMLDRRELAALSRHVFPLLSRNSTALDIGANIGNHTVFFAGHFARVVAFEPNPMVAALLRVNSMESKIEIVEIGITDVPGRLNFAVYPGLSGASRITKGPADTTIEAASLDSLAELLKLHDVAFVKIDVEEHEDKVIVGASDLLKAQQPVIAMEGNYKSNPEKGEYVTAMLRDLGYRHFYALSDGLDRMPHWLYHVIPKPIRRSRRLRLEPIESLAGRDHVMAIVSAKFAFDEDHS